MEPAPAFPEVNGAQGSAHDGAHDQKELAARSKESVTQRIWKLRANGIAGKAARLLHEPSEKDEKESGALGLVVFGFARVTSVQDEMNGSSSRGRKILQDRHEAMTRMQEGMLAVGRVVQRLPHGLQLRIEKVGEWSARQGGAVPARGMPERLTPLDIRGTMTANELRDDIRHHEFSSELQRYGERDVLLMIITKVEAHSDSVWLSMRQSRIHDQVSRTIILGAYRDLQGACKGWCEHNTDFSNTRRSTMGGRDQDAEDSEHISFNESLARDAMFSNPYAVENMCKAFRIDETARLFEEARAQPGDGKQGGGCPAMRNYLELRSRQNKNWAQQSVRKGIEHANDRNYLMAVKCYQSAIELDPDNADAYVALGAAQANQSKFEDAIKAFERAIHLQPDHVNANRYLDATKAKVRERLGPMADAIVGRERTRHAHAHAHAHSSGDGASSSTVGAGGDDANRARQWAASVRKRQGMEGGSLDVNELLKYHVTASKERKKDKSKKKKKDKKDKKKRKREDKKKRKKEAKKHKRVESSSSSTSSSSDESNDERGSKRHKNQSSDLPKDTHSEQNDQDTTPRARTSQ